MSGNRRRRVRRTVAVDPAVHWALQTSPEPGLWEQPSVRAILAVHDIAALFRLLGQEGFSQRRIAALVGMSQSEISEIIGSSNRPGRHVGRYDVLVRIADGLGIPRHYMGLAYPPPPAEQCDTDAPSSAGHAGCGKQRCDLLALILVAVYERQDQPCVGKLVADLFAHACATRTVAMPPAVPQTE